MTVVLSLVGSLWPLEPSGEPWLEHSDKLMHAGAFAVMAMCAWCVWPQAWRRSALALAAHGAWIEGLQAALTTTRTASWGDWLADLVGIALALAWCLRRHSLRGKPAEHRG